MSKKEEHRPAPRICACCQFEVVRVCARARVQSVRGIVSPWFRLSAANRANGSLVNVSAARPTCFRVGAGA